jgi:hypothetical protein
MDERRAGETRDEVLAAVRAAGYAPTDVQLKAWRRSGLIPRPVDQHGLGQARGSTTVYPAGTAAQLAALCRFHATERGLDALAFLLWWHGHPVATARVRSALERALAGFARDVAALVDDEGLTEAGWGTLDRLEATPRLAAGWSVLRRRVSRGKLSTVGRFLFLAAAGQFAAWPEQPADDIPDAKVMALAMGIGALNRLGAAFGVADWFPDDPAALLAGASELAGPDALGATLTGVTDAELERARDDLREFARVLGDVLFVLGQGPALLAAVAQAAGTDAVADAAPALRLGAEAYAKVAPLWQATGAGEQMLLFLAGLSMLRRPDLRTGRDHIVGETADLHEIRVAAGHLLPLLPEPKRRRRRPAAKETK